MMSASPQRPLLLLDVDGVLNATTPRWGTIPYRADVPSESHGRVFRMRWSPVLLNRLAKLVVDHGLVIRWSTTWADDIAAVKHAFRFPHGEPAFVIGDPNCYVWDLKDQAYRDALADPQWSKVAWIDDHIPEETIRASLKDPRNPLLIAPKMNRGITRDDMERLEAWILG